MPVFITSALSFLGNEWPALLALGAVTTAVNQLVGKIVPGSRVANIVNTVSVDYLALIAEVGGAFNLGPRKAKPTFGEPPPVAKS